MSPDAADRVPAPKHGNLWHLPDIVAVQVHHVRYKKPRRYTVAGKDREISEAVEVVIETSEPFVIRALGPVLFVGETALTVAHGEGDRRYRFVAADPAELKSGAPMSIAWNSPGAPRKTTRFTYEPPAQRTDER